MPEPLSHVGHSQRARPSELKMRDGMFAAAFPERSPVRSVLQPTLDRISCLHRLLTPSLPDFSDLCLPDGLFQFRGPDGDRVIHAQLP